MCIIGACFSPNENDRISAKLWLNSVEEMVFTNPYLGDIILLDEATVNVREIVQLLQAAYCVSTFQISEGSKVSQRRIRRQRFNMVVSVSFQRVKLRCDTDTSLLLSWQETSTSSTSHIGISTIYTRMTFAGPVSLQMRSVSGNLDSSFIYVPHLTTQDNALHLHPRHSLCNLHQLPIPHKDPGDVTRHGVSRGMLPSVLVAGVFRSNQNMDIAPAVEMQNGAARSRRGHPLLGYSYHRS